MPNLFLKPYLAEDLVLRTRARNLFWILVLFTAAMAFLGLYSAFTDDPGTAVVGAGVAVLFIVSLDVLRRGRYRDAANLAFVVLLVAGVAGSLLNRIGEVENDLFRLTAIFSMGLVLVTFFGYHGALGLIMGLVGLLTMGIILLTPYPEAELAKTLAEVQQKAQPITVMMVFLITTSVASLGLFQTGRILERNKASHQMTEASMADIQRVLSDTAASLEVSHQMEVAVQDLQQGARSIREELAVLQSQTATVAGQAREAGASSQLLEDIQNNLKTKMELQVRSIHQTSTALEQINALFQNIAASSRTKKESLSALGTQASEGERKIQQMGSAFAAMQKTAEEVLSVVHVIEDISGRTNLLAMNASIEAAHAGNSGRGFSVVASEIRKLAEETSRNSQAIRQTLDANLTHVHAAVLSSGESRELLSLMIRAFQDIQTLLDEQMKGMDEMSQATQDILHSVEQLHSGTASVQSAAQSLEGAVQTNQRQASSVRGAAEVIEGGVATLQKVAAAIAATTQTIEQFGEQNHLQAQKLRASLEAVTLTMEARKRDLL